MPSHRLSPSEFGSKTIARARARGLGEIAGTVTGRVRSAVRSGEQLIFLTRPARWSGVTERRTDEPMILERATPEDGPDYARFIGTDSAVTFARRLSEETSCWLVRGRGIVLHATWTTTGSAWTREIKRFFVTPEHGAYIYESFTRPEARGLGVYPYALTGIGNRLSLEGIESLYVGVEASNGASLRAITKAGFERRFSIAFERKLGRFHLSEPEGDIELAHRCLRAAP